MSKDLKNVNLKVLPELIASSAKKLGHYKVPLFLAFAILIYGFIGYRIYSLSSPSNDSSAVQAQVTSLTPHIDPKVVNQLNSLQDNSVSVQALFNQSRDNPFAE